MTSLTVSIKRASIQYEQNIMVVVAMLLQLLDVILMLLLLLVQNLVVLVDLHGRCGDGTENGCAHKGRNTRGHNIHTTRYWFVKFVGILRLAQIKHRPPTLSIHYPIQVFKL